MIAPSSRPRLARKARLRFDRKSGRHMLLYPEGGLLLSPTATSILGLCDGETCAAAIVDRLAAEYAGEPREAVERDVIEFLERMARSGLVRDASAGYSS
jgi:coenzyme PQQ biosynthesis protein PqqD